MVVAVSTCVVKVNCNGGREIAVTDARYWLPQRRLSKCVGSEVNNPAHMSYEVRLRPFHLLGKRFDMWFTGKGDLESQKEALFNDLFLELKHAAPGARLSYQLRNRLERFSIDARREIVSLVKDGCAPLFVACKRGHVEIVQYLITTCDADLEQKGFYEVPDDRSVHCVTPLWCAAVSGRLPVIRCLVEHGADVNAISDTGSTPVRSACFMTHLDVVSYLVDSGADIIRPNYNGGTCLINSVQSAQLCLYLLQHGAAVNARDVQNKTALHYAIQEHRFETTKLLLEHGADPHARSRYHDDALQTACLKGATKILEYLVSQISYAPERLADAYQLLGSTFLDEHNDSFAALSHWHTAAQIRQTLDPPARPLPAPGQDASPRSTYGGAVEFASMEDLNNVSTDVDAMRTQSLLICERILGPNHKDTLFRLMYRGASYADALRYQRCIDLWQRALQIRVQKDTILYTDTLFTAQALVRLYVDLNQKKLEMSHCVAEEVEPRFEDVVTTFRCLADQVVSMRHLLEVRPVYKRQQECYDRTLRCLTHLIYLLVETYHTPSQEEETRAQVERLVRHNPRSAATGDSLLHLCVSQLNTIKSSYFSDDNQVIFPNLNVIRLLLDSGAHVNARNESRSTPLHIAATPYNFHSPLVEMLLEHGAHLDQPNRAGDCPAAVISGNPQNTVDMMKYVSLRCFAASAVCRHGIPYRGQVPLTLEKFVDFHHV
ncbi:protein fem-1 homolog A [Bacillus rossius redtenbacheri]|uniref:protein fem-1 homolog A n=1 Tax=Bacillus rossius redtenbacheri TaxID=93214 RepID=UPI002FDD77A0